MEYLVETEGCNKIIGFDFGADIILPESSKKPGRTLQRDTLNMKAMQQVKDRNIVDIEIEIIAASPGIDGASLGPVHIIQSISSTAKESKILDIEQILGSNTKIMSEKVGKLRHIDQKLISDPSDSTFKTLFLTEVLPISL